MPEPANTSARGKLKLVHAIGVARAIPLSLLREYHICIHEEGPLDRGPDEGRAGAAVAWPLGPGRAVIGFHALGAVHTLRRGVEKQRPACGGAANPTPGCAGRNATAGAVAILSGAILVTTAPCVGRPRG